MLKTSTALTLLAALVGFDATTRADVKVPAIFGDHMVVQRGVKIPLWGTAEAGEAVTVRAGGQERSTRADEKGKWRVELEPIESTQPIEIAISGKNAITIKDVLVGDVWLCSGQSNMGFALHRASNGAEAVKSANRPTMRLFTVGRSHPDQPAEEMQGEWKVCTPESAKDFSAVAYFMGAELQQNLKQPIGLIDSSYGGTRAEAWLPRATFDALKLPYEPAWTESWLNPKPDPKAKTPEKPRPHQAVSGLYNGMIAPLAGFALKGAVWYQGETNTAYPKEYRDVLKGLITGWRGAWTSASSVEAKQGDFPFVVVQLPNFDSGTRDWVAMRESQAQVAKDVPNVGLVVTIDVGNPKDIHPTDKLTVGKRAALVALKVAYGQDVPHSGPTFKSMQIDAGRGIVSFDHVYYGLVAKGGELHGFEIAGGDGKFVPATAKIDGERVIVSADAVEAAVAVRYGWANNPRCTLYNAADLPAAPFDAARQ